MHIIQINAITNCLISYMLLNSLSALTLILFIFIEHFLFSLLTCFLLANTRWDYHEKLGLLSFRANVEVFPSLTDIQVRGSGAANQNSKQFVSICHTKFNSVEEYTC